MNKRWIVEPAPDREKVELLSKQININEVIATVLVQRGVENFESAKNYFRPSPDHLHDPFLMADMQKAVDRLILALKNNQNILIYGDYDVDGTTSVALAYGYLNKLSPNCKYYINDREEEGYGISQQGIDFAIENKVNLIISIDCGIKATSLVQKAADNKIDFIICDHHNPGEELPPALAVLDPKRLDCNYPFKELSGCGIGYKLLQALEQQTGEKHDLESYLDLVAVSIAADIVPLTDENRVLCSLGIKQLQDNPRPGLKVLRDLNDRAVISVTNILFGIAPRINAAGRIAHANHAVELLISDTIEIAQEKSLLINQKNNERRDFDSFITDEALEILKNEKPGKKSTVLYKEDWHKGVIGIVASRCIEHYFRPTIILTRSNGSVTGSARSVPGFDIYNAILQCEDLLDKFGGHTFAAGLTLSIENVSKFQEKFETVVSTSIDDECLIPAINIDAELPFDLISDKFCDLLEQMEPFGPDNPGPVFVAHNVCLYGKPRLLKNSHIKFAAVQEGSHKIIETIGFGLGHHYEDLLTNPVMSLAFSVEYNEYMGVKKVQLKIKDIKFANHGIKS